MSAGTQALFRNRAALRKVSLMWRCQPEPRLRKCSITSRSSRSDTSFFVGAFCRPRVRRYQATMSGWASSAGRALANIASSSGGLSGSASAARCISASSSSLVAASERSALRRATLHLLLRCGDIESFFSVFGFAKTDNPDQFTTTRERHRIERDTDKSDRDLAQFPVVLSVVDDGNGCIPVEPTCRGEVDLMVAKIDLSLVLIPSIGVRRRQELFCSYRMLKSQLVESCNSLTFRGLAA
jgi:hypothetical protein